MTKCVICDRRGIEGSLQHPYCAEHWQSEWAGDYAAYITWLSDKHRYTAHNSPRRVRDEPTRAN